MALDLSRLPEGYLETVRAFADKAGKRANLEDNIRYLSTYGNHGAERNDTILFKDFAPYSFYFEVQRRARTFTEYAHKCKKCGVVYWSEEAEPWKQCYEYECQTVGQMEIVDSRQASVESARSMNGGLIFHAPHDGGGNGGAPTFAVCLSPTDGWSIHT